MLKPGLQLRIGQQLTMTPQLQQAIRLLQLPVMELQTEIQQALESNLMLEVEEPDGPPEEPAAEATEDATSDELEVEYAEISTLGESRGKAPVPDDLRDNQDFPDRRESLQDHLVWQLEMDDFTDPERIIGRGLIDAISEDGYLTQSPEEIVEMLTPDVEVTTADVERVLARIQQYDPIGVGARHPAECLMLQLSGKPDDTPGLELARAIAAEHLDLVADQQYPALRRRLGVDADSLSEALDLLRSLDPHPGASLPSEPPTYVIPDVFVRKLGDEWVVEANPSIAPRLRVNQTYARLVARERDYQELRNQLQEARWLIKSLEIRNETLIKVAHCIVRRQRDFLEEGETAMKPMILKDVAEEVDMHESTISRATTGKYMHTPRGVIEFKYFFSSSVSGTDGGEVSSTAIRARIRQIISEENPRKPLSDNAIARLLKGEGVDVARRTVAKYRESLGLPASSHRKHVPVR